MDTKKLDAAFAKIINGLMELKDSLKDETVVSVQSAQVSEQPTETLVVKESDFETLKTALESDKWPQAVNTNLICDPNSESDKVERGKGIIELMIEEDLNGLTFLDYGCGEGHCAHLSADYKTKMSIGYDIKKYESWGNFDDKSNAVLTDDFNVVQENGPYDVITLFDVLDHVEREDPISLLKKVGDLLKEGGKIYMRCHPFTSRHSTHLYHDLNKAYVHLVFTPDEIRKLVPESKHEENNIGVKFPLRTYDEYIGKAGLKTVNRRDITEKVEPFFKIPKITERIMATTGFTQLPEWQMSLQFVDYVLSK